MSRDLWMRAGVPVAVLALLLLLLSALGPVLMPFLSGIALAYLCDPLVEKAVRWKWPRSLAVSVVLLFLLLCLVMFVLLVVPLLHHEAVLIAKRLPAAVNWLETTVLPQLAALTGNAVGTLDLQHLRELLGEQLPQAGSVLARVLGTVGRSSLAIVGTLASFLLIPVIFFYLLRDWPQLRARAHDLLPWAWRPTVHQLVGEMDGVLSAFVRGQLMVMLCLAVYYASGLALVGLDVALLVGAITGLASFIPYLGFGLGMLLGVLAAALQFSDPMMLLWVLAVFAGGQLLEGLVLQPLLLGDRIGLHPVAVLFAVLAGGELFGFVGVLLALPTAAVLKVVLLHARTRYQQSALYGAPPPPLDDAR